LLVKELQRLSDTHPFKGGSIMYPLSAGRTPGFIRGDTAPPQVTGFEVRQRRTHQQPTHEWVGMHGRYLKGRDEALIRSCQDDHPAYRKNHSWLTTSQNFLG